MKLTDISTLFSAVTCLHCVKLDEVQVEMLFNLLYELLSGTAVSTVICNLQVQVTNQVEDSMLTLYMQVENANCATSVVFFRLRSVQSA